MISYQTDGLHESEAQNGVREELATQRWVAGDGGQQRRKHQPNSDTRSPETDGSGTHTNVLGDLDEGVGHLRRVGTAGLDADRGDLGAGRVQEGGGALHGVEGGGLAAGDCFIKASVIVVH